MRPKPPSQKSKNCKVVQHLRSVVQDLQRRVKSCENDILIYQSLENNFDNKVDRINKDLERERTCVFHLERQLEESEAQHRKVERENSELERITHVFWAGNRVAWYRIFKLL